MIRAEIRFKNSAFVSALERNGYKSMAEFSRQSTIRYDKLIDYANLRHVFDDDEETKQMIVALLQSDEWTLFEQYREVIEMNGGVNKKIVADIPVNKIISLSSTNLLKLESEDDVEYDAVHEALKDQIKIALGTLKDRERDVLERYFGLGKHEEPQILEEIGDDIGLTRERVRQIKEKGVRRLRHRSRSRVLREFLGQEKSI